MIVNAAVTSILPRRRSRPDRSPMTDSDAIALPWLTSLAPMASSS